MSHLGIAVKNQMPMSRSRIIASPLARAARWAAIDALIGAPCAALYGLLFSGVSGILYGEPGKIATTMLYFTACGAAAGALVGAFGALIGGETNPSEEDWPSGAEEEPRPEDRLGSTRTVRQPVNRLAGMSAINSTAESGTQPSASPKPSWN